MRTRSSSGILIGGLTTYKLTSFHIVTQHGGQTHEKASEESLTPVSSRDQALRAVTQSPTLGREPVVIRRHRSGGVATLDQDAAIAVPDQQHRRLANAVVIGIRQNGQASG